MSTINLLIVDDEERFLSTAKKLLEKRDVSVITCTNGFDALRIIEERRVDVIVLDIKMPGMDGVEVLRKVKQNHPDIEVILLTGHASVESAVEGLKLGAADYLMKPSTISDILVKVEEAFEKKRAREERQRKSKVDKIISHPMAVFDDEEE